MDDEQLNQVFSALADPTRRAILGRLTEGDATVTELTKPFDISQPAVSKHLKILERAGLITRSRSATARLSHLEAAPLAEATDYMQRYRRFWEAGFDRLEARLTEFMAGSGGVADQASADQAPADDAPADQERP